MDLSVMETLISTQDKAYQSALEIFVNQINGKLQAFQGVVNDLTRSLEFTQSEVADLKQQVKQLEGDKKNKETEIQKITGDLRESERIINELKDRCNYQEDYSRRNNIRIAGMPELHGETWEQTTVQVSKLLEEKLQLPNIELERAHRVGQRREDQHRQVIARFLRYSDREAVIRNAAKLRGTRIYINEDLCHASQEVRRAKLPLLRQAKSEGKIAYFNHTKLIIRERPGGSGRDSSQTSRDSVRTGAGGVGSGASSGAETRRRSTAAVPVGAMMSLASTGGAVNATTPAVEGATGPATADAGAATGLAADGAASGGGIGGSTIGVGAMGAGAVVPEVTTTRITRGKGKGQKNTAK